MADINSSKPTKKKSNWDSWNEKVKAQKDNKKVAKETEKVATKFTKQAKKGNWLIFALLIFFVVGCVGGYVTYALVCKNDCFVMVGVTDANQEIYVGANEEQKTYIELGAKCVAFGKDISNEVTVSYKYREDATSDYVNVDKVDENVAGYYYAIYKVDNVRYKSVTLIRLIVVTRVEGE